MFKNFALAACLLGLAGTGAAARTFEVPTAWRDVGAVSGWMALDSHFMRIEGLTSSPGPLTFGFDQKPLYAKTRQSQSKQGAVDLAQFLALTPREQAQRQAAADRYLDPVRRFRRRMADLVMEIERQRVVSPGRRAADSQAVGDMIGGLQTAVGLDPSNVYAWHLLSYLTDNCGDLYRALDALDGCREALSVLPDTVLTDVRRRAELDRAWILRDLGYFDQAGEALDRIEDPGPYAREALLVRGLIAAQSGDLNRAFRIAGKLARWDLPVFQRDWFAPVGVFKAAIINPLAWKSRPSDYAKNWILALAWLHDGNVAQAAHAMHEYSLDRHYELGRRFLDEAALVYEATGRPELAARFWAMAELYVPFQPYLVYKSYGMRLAALTGRMANVPFVLAFDSFLQTGSRLAYGMALVSQAYSSATRADQVALADRAIAELEICVRSGVNVAPAALALGYAQAVAGNPHQMVLAADQGLAALALPGHDQTQRRALERLRATALATPEPGMGDGEPGRQAVTSAAVTEQSGPGTEARLRAAFAAAPNSGPARRRWARFQMRQGSLEPAAELVERPFLPGGEPSIEDWVLRLELDRLRNDTAHAAQLVQALQNGQGSRWPDPRVWTLAGIICQDNGLPGARAALEFALSLDPGNIALQRHLETTAR